MTDIEKKGTEVQYWTHSIYADCITGPLDARIIQAFNEPFIRKASDYMVAVERMSVNVNGIPMLPAGQSMRFVNGQGALLKDLILPDIWSVQHFIQQATLANWTFEVLLSGQLQMRDNTFSTNYLQIDYLLANFLNFPELIAPSLGAVSYTTPHPITDCNDRLNTIQVTSNLPLISDRVGQVQTNIVTDFGFPQSLQSSVTGPLVNYTQVARSESWSPRQKLHYIPTVRRYLNLLSNGAISYIDIAAHWVDNKGVSTRIVLPIGGEFSIKIGFYKLV